MNRVLGLMVVALTARSVDAFAEDAPRLRNPNVMVGLNLQGFLIPLPGIQLGLQPHGRVQIDGGLLAVPIRWVTDHGGVA